MSDLKQGDEVCLASGRTVVLTFVSPIARWTPVEHAGVWCAAGDTPDATGGVYMSMALDRTDAICLAKLLNVARQNLQKNG